MASWHPGPDYSSDHKHPAALLLYLAAIAVVGAVILWPVAHAVWRVAGAL